MATKSYSKHKEFKEFSSSSKGTRSGTTVPYTDEAFDMMKSELIPKGSKLGEVARTGGGQREYHYEYKEEKHPSGKYDRKDLHTVEEYTVPPKTVPKNSESTSYYYEREERELPSFSTSNAAARTYNYENTTSSTPGGQTKIPKNSESTSYYYEREERELPSFSTSNAAARTYNYENTTSSTPGYSKIKSSKVTKDLSHNVEELDSLLDDLQKDQERQLYKSGYTSDTAESTSFDYKRVSTPVKAPSSGYSTLKREERMESSTWNSSPPPPPPPATRTAELRREEMYKEERHESRVVPSVSPAPLVVPQTTICHNCHQSSSTLSRSSTPMNKVTTTVKTYTYEVPADQHPASVPLPTRADHQRTYVSSHENMRTETNTSKIPASPALGCQYCSHCNTRVREYKHISTSDEHTNERMVYPSPVNEVKLLPVNAEPHNYGPTSYKFSETTYEAHNSTERYPSPAPFPRPSTPSPGNQQTPKKLDDLLADFPEARFPVTQTDGVTQRKIAVTHERSTAAATKPVAGPAVYYPPGHVPFEKKEGYQASAMQSGGAYASGKGMYEYEAGSKSKEKHSEKKTAVPICLPLCCAMPCVIM